MSVSPLILLIEDEAPARAVLQVALTKAGYRCLQAGTGEAGLAAIAEHSPSLVLLDLGLPDIDGVELTHRIRARSDVPIIVVSARGQEEHKIAALDGGANDYVTKPFAAGELLARIRAGLRATRRDAEERGVLAVGELSVDFDVRRVMVAGAEVHLTPIEFRLLVLFMRSGGRVLTHKYILREVWGPHYESQLNYLRVYMKKLRHKIEKEPARPKYLLNDPGIGYRLRTQD